MTIQSANRCKWWGWGKDSESFHLPDPDQFWAYIRDRLGETKPSPRLDSLSNVDVRPSQLSADDLKELTRVCEPGGVSTDNTERAIFSLGKGYKDLVQMRRGLIPNPTDAVVRPESEAQLLELLRVAAQRQLAVIPFGGGTSVVGGVEPTGERKTITLDMSGLSRPIEINRESATAVVQAGIMGPDLERYIRPAGFTLGHFPQSFMHSTVGGWIATRSAGQNSTKYGAIEKHVQSVRLAHPEGILSTPEVPAAAAGPDLVQMITGSEGALGVITQAVLRLSARPKVRDYRGYLFRSFADGVQAAREIIQADIAPALLRLSDEHETESSLALRATPKGTAAAIERVGRWYLGRKGLDLQTGAIMILGFEGSESAVRHERAVAAKVLKRHGAASLGSGAGRAWRRGRFSAPHLRDMVLDRGIMIDTLETSTTWDRYLDLHATVHDALRDALGERSVVMAHLSHSYTDGGSIYYTFLAPQEEGDEIEQWERVKAAATTAIVSNGGALSHHHSIGSEHRAWIRDYLGEEGARWLSTIKRSLDPDNILNPGKLVPEPDDTAAK
ncbi:MAG: FAD-binding oxidoreductase [Chloroflexi bacterium]|nr:FAD-binding oxidoreductase [Chloroflexota bacterium]